MHRWALLLLALAACESPSAPRELVARLGSSDVWSGGDAMIISPSFVSLTTLPRVRIGADTLSVRRLNDSTLAAQLPDGNGARTLTIETPGFHPFETYITLYGFRSMETGPVLSGHLELIPNTTRVLGAGNGLVEVDVRTGGVVRHWADTVHSAECASAVGPSVRASYYIFWGKDPADGQCKHPWAWRYAPDTLERNDSLSAFPDAWGMAEIGPSGGGSISGGDDGLLVSHCDAAGCSSRLYWPMGGALSGVSLARKANRAVLHHYFGFLVDATTGDTLGRLPFGPPPVSYSAWYYHLENAAFSTNEDTLYAVGNSGHAGSILLIAATQNGAFIDSLPLPGTVAVDIRLDLQRDWLYIALLEFGQETVVTHPQLRIYDRATLHPIATLRAPPEETVSLTDWHQFRLVPDPVMHAMYLAATRAVVGFDAPSRILRFDLLP